MKMPMPRDTQPRHLLAHLWAVEDAGLVHVVPHVEVGRGALVLGQRELLRPPRPHFWVQHVQVEGGPRPAPPAAPGSGISGTQHGKAELTCSASTARAEQRAPIIVRAILIPHEVFVLQRLLIDVVVFILFDVRVDDGDRLAAVGCDVILQLDRVGEQVLVPSEVPSKRMRARLQTGPHLPHLQQLCRLQHNTHRLPSVCSMSSQMTS